MATVRTIRLLTVKPVPDSSQLSIQDTVLQALEQGQINQIIEFEKLGRVFYARQGGRVSELLFQNSDTERKGTVRTLMSFILPERKRLYRAEHQKDNILLRAIPSFFRLTPQDREILQLRVDEQRNLLYSLCETADGRSSVEVIDLGVLGDDFSCQTRITMDELADELVEKGLVRQMTRSERREWAELHRIVDIQPVQWAESRGCHLVLTTVACEKIFIALGEAARDIAAVAEGDLERLGTQSDYLLGDRITPGDWRALGLKHLPEDSEVLRNPNFAREVMHGLYQTHVLRARDQLRINSSREEPWMVHADNTQSLLVYQTSEGRDQQEEDGDAGIRLCFI